MQLAFQLHTQALVCIWHCSACTPFRILLHLGSALFSLLPLIAVLVQIVHNSSSPLVSNLFPTFSRSCFSTIGIAEESGLQYVFVLCKLSTMPPTRWVPGRYPRTRRVNHIDVHKSTLHGEVAVPDAYHYFEDQDTPETDAFINVQAAYTRHYLDQNPNLARLEDAFNKCNNYQKVCNIQIFPQI